MDEILKWIVLLSLSPIGIMFWLLVLGLPIFLLWEKLKDWIKKQP